MCERCQEYLERTVILTAILNYQASDIAVEEASTRSIPEMQQFEMVRREAQKHLQEFRSFFDCQKNR